MKTGRLNDAPFATVFSENNKIFRRTNRIYLTDNHYYYRTREGEIRGPFLSKPEVRSDLNVFIQVTAIEREMEKKPLLKFVG